MLPLAARWIASRSLSSGAHSRDPLARNDDVISDSIIKQPQGQHVAFPRRVSARVMRRPKRLERRERRECRMLAAPMARLQQSKQAAVTTG
jgi:hypothetical protein